MTKQNLSALELKKFPNEHQKYIRQEAGLVKKYVYGNVLDVGMGTGRIVPHIAEQYTSYLGIDKDPQVVADATKKMRKYPKAKFKVLDANSLDSYFPKDKFDVALCLWNTLHLIGNEAKSLRKIGLVTKGLIVVTLVAKNAQSFKARKGYYAKFGIPCKTDEKTQTIYSKVWGKSKAYTVADLKKLASDSGLVLKEHGAVGHLGIYGIYAKRR